MLSLPLISCQNLCRRPISANPSGSIGSSLFADEAFAAANSPLLGGYDDESCSMLVESYVHLGRHRHCRRKRRTNRAYCKQSVLLSPWYVNFLRPGFTRDLTHELSSSDCFGEFRSLFWMKLKKVEELTDILIDRGYIELPRLLKFWDEFRERSELFVLTALFRLGLEIPSVSAAPTPTSAFPRSGSSFLFS
jgi:hypothetical protein